MAKSWKDVTPNDPVEWRIKRKLDRAQRLLNIFFMVGLALLGLAYVASVAWRWSGK